MADTELLVSSELDSMIEDSLLVAVPVEISLDVNPVLDLTEESTPLVVATAFDVVASVGSGVLSVIEEFESPVDAGPVVEKVGISDELELCVDKGSLLEEPVVNELEFSVVEGPLLEEFVENKLRLSIEEGIELKELLLVDEFELPVDEG